MAINTQVQKICMEEGVGFVDMWLNFVGSDDFFMRDGLHLTGKGVAADRKHSKEYYYKYTSK